MASSQRHAIGVIDLAFGDCGKGTIVDFLTRRFGAHTVVRFNGGPQAGHNVVTRDGRHHTFSQFGSGTLVPGVRTLLSRFMLIEPYALFNEARHLCELGLPNPFDRLLIDTRCLVITPPHQAANRLRELARGQSPHGTCGMGVGEAKRDQTAHSELMLHAGELGHRQEVRKKLRAIRDWKAEEFREVIAALQGHPKASFSLQTLLVPSWIDTAVETYAELAQHASILDESGVRAALNPTGPLIFEGAQGVLLDETHGFHPYTTWSTTTFANADAVLDEVGYDGRRTRIGVLRTYFTRHGAGPLVTEEDSLRSHLPERHNDDSGWQGRFRTGIFDAVAARYAIAVAGPLDAMAITHMDRLPQLPPCICNRYDHEDGSQGSSGPTELDWFVREEGQVRDIRVHRHASLAQRESLSLALHRCRPIHTPLNKIAAETFVEVMEQELGVPVGIASWGSRAEDKRLIKLPSGGCSACRR